MTATTLTVNGRTMAVRLDANTPLLWVLREEAGCTGVRFGCGQGLCGACTVRVEGRAVHSCDTPLWSVANKHIETIEGMHRHDHQGLIAAFDAHQAGQCGFCLAGIAMRAATLLAQTPRPARGEIVAALDGHLCRCGEQQRIIDAIERAVAP